MFPFLEERIDSFVRRRTFDSRTDQAELIWHRDKNDRTLRVIDGEGWYIQFDDELPISLIRGVCYTIPAAVWHRLVKKKYSDSLVVEITEA